jgi:hypothetical protein
MAHTPDYEAIYDNLEAYIKENLPDIYRELVEKVPFRKLRKEGLCTRLIGLKPLSAAGLAILGELDLATDAQDNPIGAKIVSHSYLEELLEWIICEEMAEHLELFREKYHKIRPNVILKLGRYLWTLRLHYLQPK